MAETPTPYLPMRDPNIRERKEQLAAGRVAYQFTEDRIPGVPMATEVPEADRFRNAWWNMRTDLDDLIRNQNAILGQTIPSKELTLAEHAGLFPLLDDPRCVASWDHDAFFAEQRLSGPNPLSISRVASSGTEQHCFIEDDDVANVLDEGESLESLADEGRLYELDFVKLLDGVPVPTRNAPTDPFGYQRPIALFAIQSDGKTLMPIAIQPDQDRNRIYTPASNPNHWMMAKLGVQLTDANFHQLYWHLGRTHLVSERVAVAAGRNLAPNHPVRILLDAHLQYVIAINRDATTELTQPGGPIDILFAGNRGDSLAIAKHGALSFDFATAQVPADLGARGVENLPNYAYGEDAQLIWTAIDNYVRAYLGLYYQQVGDNPPIRDTELRAFVLTLKHAAKIDGLPYAFVFLEDLVKLLTTAIYTSSALHAAINYPQYDYEGFSPNMPLSVYDDSETIFDMPSPGRDDLENFLKSYLPQSRQAGLQIELTRTLSNFRYDRLGEYDHRLVDPRARAEQLKFQLALRGIETEITRRNQTRTWPYEYLLPSNIPNSTSL